MRISDWSSDVCSSDLRAVLFSWGEEGGRGFDKIVDDGPQLTKLSMRLARKPWIFGESRTGMALAKPKGQGNSRERKMAEQPQSDILDAKFVRVRNRRENGLVEFDFAIGEIGRAHV